MHVSIRRCLVKMYRSSRSSSRFKGARRRRVRIRETLYCSYFCNFLFFILF